MNFVPMLALRSSPFQAETADRPRIRANRQEVDDRFPVLGFTVDTRGLPWYEVILASVPAHFDPARAHERDASFYSSRTDSGLISAETTVYTVPATVLKRFAPGRSVYYTMVAYADRQLGAPVPSHTLEELLHDAPRVQLSAGFTGRTLATVLGVPAHLLQEVPAKEVELAAPDADDDRGEGEDGYGRSSEAFAADEPWSEEPAQAQQMEAPYGATDSDAYRESYGLADESTPEEPAEGTGAPVSQGSDWAAEEEYDDGFGAPLQATAAALSSEPPYDYGELSSAAGSSYPRDASAPAMLEDDEHRDGEGDAAVSYSDGYDDAGYAADAAPAPPLDVPAQKRLLDAVIAVAGPPDGYATTLADAEFNGQLGDHPARGRHHLGLAFGIGLASQDRGDLGALLRLMQARDAATFQQVFGPHAQALLEVTNRSGPRAADSPDGRGPRVQPVGGEDLWSAGWLARFKESARADLFGAGRPQLFNGAQNEQVVTLYLHPMLSLARCLGLNTQRALGVLFDRALQMGTRRATDWVIAAISPIQTLAQRQQALGALGHASLQAFQRTQPDLPADGEWGPATHVALLAALRSLGPASPLPVPHATGEALATLMRRAATEPWHARAQRVHAALDDTAYAL